MESLSDNFLYGTFILKNIDLSCVENLQIITYNIREQWEK